MKKKRMSRLAIVFTMFVLLLAGCSGDNTKAGMSTLSADGQELSESGVLRLKVNPDISIHYNENGVVTEVKGENEDGVKLIENYADYIGKESSLVLEELIVLLSEAGYFVEDIEGETKRIVLELEDGSQLPDGQFLEKMTTNIKEAMKELEVEREVVNDSEIISLEEAKAHALNHAGVKAADADFDDGELESDDGLVYYEIEFDTMDYDYEYKVDAVSGEILEEESQKNDDRKAENDDKDTADKKEYISMNRAKEIAFKHAGVNGKDVRFDEAEFDKEDGIPFYELEFEVNENEYEYEIHAVSGKVLDYDQEIEESKAKAKPKSQPDSKPVSAPEKAKQMLKDEAIQMALKHAGLSRSAVELDDVELDKDDGKIIWELEFKAGDWEYEYEIDASSRKILDFEKENDD